MNVLLNAAVHIKVEVTEIQGGTCGHACYAEGSVKPHDRGEDENKISRYHL